MIQGCGSPDWRRLQWRVASPPGRETAVAERDSGDPDFRGPFRCPDKNRYDAFRQAHQQINPPASHNHDSNYHSGTAGMRVAPRAGTSSAAGSAQEPYLRSTMG